jgi:MFS family permease
VTRADANVAALALLVQPAAAIAGRWLAGRRGDRPSARPGALPSDRPSDRQGSAALLVPGVLAAAAGVLVLSLTAVPAAVIAGAAVFGLGFGVTQNVTQTVMYDRVPESAYGASSALWNLAYDGGMGLGAAGFGVLALHTGYPVAFVLVAAILAAAVLPAVLPAVTRARTAARSD